MAKRIRKNWRLLAVAATGAVLHLPIGCVAPNGLMQALGDFVEDLIIFNIID